MGGCCCCCCFSSNGVELNGPPPFYHYPVVLEEQQPLSQSGAASALSPGLLVDTNLETSIPDTYIPPPAPIPYDAPVRTINTEHGGETNIINNAGVIVKKTKDCDCKVQSEIELVEAKEGEGDLDKSGELKKSKEPVVLVPEECPTCLEEYDEENPKIVAKCEHHFHLSCILEWMERSDTCPVCDKEMVFDLPIDG